jgi:hypothetical protein
MSEIRVNDSGTWRTPQPHVKDVATWRPIQETYVNDSGTWRSVYRAFAINGSFTAWNVSSSNADGNSAYAEININSNGTVTGTGDSVSGSGNWGSPTTTGIGASYYVKMTPTSGTFDSNQASAWISLSSNRTAYLLNDFGSYSCTFTIQIATDAIGSNVVFTSTGNVLSLSHF